MRKKNRVKKEERPDIGSLWVTSAWIELVLGHTESGGCRVFVLYDDDGDEQGFATPWDIVDGSVCAVDRLA